MRIAIVSYTDFIEPNAPARLVYLVARGLAELGHEVHAVTPQRYQPGPLEADLDGIHVHWGVAANLAAHHDPTVMLRSRLAAWRIIRALSADRHLDWLLLYNLGVEGILVGLTVKARGGRIATKYTDLRYAPPHPTFFEQLRGLSYQLADRTLPRMASLNIVASRYLARQFQAIAPETPCLIVPAPVDCERFQVDPGQGQAFRDRWHLGQEVVISFLGSFWYVEGVAVLLRAAHKLADQGFAFRLVISGRAPVGVESDDPAQLVEELGLQDRVILTGWLDTAQVLAAMSAADILVAPKLDDPANVACYPIKLAEYLSMGRAMVTTTVGDMPLHVKHQQDALLCEPGNADALAETLATLITDPELRARLAAAARPCSFRHFDYRVVAAQMEAAMSNGEGGDKP